MVQRASQAIQEELCLPPDELAPLDDRRLLDLDSDEESPFLRAQKRVSARRSPIPRRTAARLLWSLLAILAAAASLIGAATLYRYGEHSPRFRLESSDQLEMSGLDNVTHAQIMEVMGGDIGRNIFFIPLAQRQKQLEQIPWVELASVMRFAPNRIKIQIHERRPVAFARMGSKVMLVDPSGVLMDLPPRKKYSFPVIVGMSLTEPHSTRASRMKIFNQLVEELDSGGAHYSEDLSEVDLSDPEDVKVLTNDRDGEVLVHLGSSSYLDRFKIYVAHLREWRQQFPKLESVDLRYERQIIVNPDLAGRQRQPPLSAEAAKRALAAGVKPAALISPLPVALPAPHAAVIKPVAGNNQSPLPATVQKTRKPGAVSREHRRSRHRVLKPGGRRRSKPQGSSALQKPSPASPKGQGSH